MQEIVNNVICDTLIKRTELKEFQGDLKFKDDVKNKALQERIKIGFNAPLFLRFDHDNYILDGHQRLIALNVLAEEGYMLKDDLVPVIYIKAETEIEAKQKVGEYNAKYSSINIEAAELFFDNVNLDNILIPELDIKPVTMEEEPENLTQGAKEKPYCVKISTKMGKEKIDMLMEEIQPILESYDCFERSFSAGEL